MKELEAKHKLEIKSLADFENSLKSRLANYEIKYRKFTDIWEISNKSFKHSFWYNPNKLSKIITKQKRELKEVIILNIILMILLFVSLYIGIEYKPLEGTEYSWLTNPDIAIEIFAVLILGTNWLVYYFKPQHKERLAEEHNTIVDTIKEIASE